MAAIRITSVSKELPKYYRKTEDIIPMVKEWMSGQEDRFRRKAIKIMEGAEVDSRYSIMDPEQVFNNPSFGERNDIYKEEITRLGKNVLQKALKKANWKP